MLCTKRSVSKCLGIQPNALSACALVDRSLITKRDNARSYIVNQALGSTDNHCTLAISLFERFADDIPASWPT